MSDIIDAIDALIEDQLAEGEPYRGFDAGDPDFPRCPHCDRDWHGFPLTERVVDMRRRGSFDEGYRVDQDDSTVLCPGSAAYGPARREALRQKMDWFAPGGPLEITFRDLVRPFVFFNRDWNWGDCDFRYEITVDDSR